MTETCASSQNAEASSPPSTSQHNNTMTITLRLETNPLSEGGRGSTRATTPPPPGRASHLRPRSGKVNGKRKRYDG